MDREDVRGPAYAPMHSIEAVVQEMLGLIRERMRMTETQAGLLEPVVRRAVHQIARKMELQPIIYGRELAQALDLVDRSHADEWITRNFGEGWLIKTGKQGSHKMIGMCRASFFALLDEYKAQQATKSAAKQLKALGNSTSKPAEKLSNPSNQKIAQRKRRERERQAKKEQKT